MNKNERGFSSPLAMAVIFSLSVMALSYAMLVASTERKIVSYTKYVNDIKEAEEIVDKLLEKIQHLAKEEFDVDNSPLVEEIENEFYDNNLQLFDISTAVNCKFLKKEILESEAFKSYLNSSYSKTTEYGWINKKYADKELVESINKDYSNKEKLPFYSVLPFYNIFRMDRDFLITILNYNKIKEPEEAFDKLLTLDQTQFNKKELAKVFGIDENNQLFDFIGTKTLFWKAMFETDAYKVEAIFAAVSDKNDKNIIEKYILVEENLKHKGGESC